jgi:hypothetical protein
MKKNQQYYTFISYKHYDNATNQFEMDTYWAISIAKGLKAMRIPNAKSSYKVDENYLINTTPRDKTINPVFRDEDSMASETSLKGSIRHALENSRTLVIITSDEMLKDQREKVKNKENAWCFEEIEYYIKLGHTLDDIYIVYASESDLNYSYDFIPDPLKRFKGYNGIKPICVNDYTHGTNKKLSEMKKEATKKITAAVASNIFHTDPDTFLRYNEEQERKRKITLITLTSIIFVLLMGVLFTFNSLQTTKINRLIEQSRVALSQGDRQAALKLSLESCDLPLSFSRIPINNLRKYLFNKTTSKAILHNWVEFSEDGSKLCLYDSDFKGRYIAILKTSDFSEIKRIPYFHSSPMRVIPDPQMEKIAVLDWDSLRVYDIKSGKVVKTALIGAGSDFSYSHYWFSNDGKFFLSQRAEQIISVSMESNDIEELIISDPQTLQEFRLISGHLIMRAFNKSDNSFYTILTNPLRKELISHTKISGNDLWDYCPQTKTLAVLTEKGITLVNNAEEETIPVPFKRVNTLSFSPQKGLLAYGLNSDSNQKDTIVINGRAFRYTASDVIKWISPTDIKYKDAYGKIVLMNVSSGKVFDLEQDMTLSHFKVSENHIINYESSAEIVGGYRYEVNIPDINCIKYNWPDLFDCRPIKDLYYIDQGKKVIYTIPGKAIYCQDEINGDVIWDIKLNSYSSQSPIQGINHQTGMILINNTLYNSLSGEVIKTLQGWTARFIGNDFIAIEANGGTTFISLPDLDEVATIDCPISKLRYSSNFFISPRTNEKDWYYLFDCSTMRGYSISDDLSERDLIISNDRSKAITFGVDGSKETRNIRKYSFRVYDIYNGSQICQDSIYGYLVWPGSTMFNGNNICFVLENGFCFYDIQKKKKTIVYTGLDNRPTNPVQISDYKYLFNVPLVGIYEINLKTSKIRKTKYHSNGYTIELFNNQFLLTGSSLYDVKKGRIIASDIQPVTRIEDEWIYSISDNKEIKIPFLNDSQLKELFTKEVGDRVLTEKERMYYQNINQ